MSLRIFKTLPGLFFAFTLSAAHLPDPAVDTDRSAAKGKQTAVLAGGCFWCTEAVFELFTGIDKVVSGYSGGDAKTAHYEIVGSGATDHAESIEITFDPAKISYGQILKIFFSVAHDPTQLNRQGPDYGRQYRSAIFYNSPEQQHIAEAYIQQLNEAKVFKSKIVTQVVPLENVAIPPRGTTRTTSRTIRPILTCWLTPMRRFEKPKRSFPPCSKSNGAPWYILACSERRPKRRLSMTLRLAALLLLACPLWTAAPVLTPEERIQWFRHDKFGMFIHWGPYSLLAGEWNGQQVPVGRKPNGSCSDSTFR